MEQLELEVNNGQWVMEVVYIVSIEPWPFCSIPRTNTSLIKEVVEAVVAD